MQLIVLAAGMGRRLRHVTRDMPKCMIDVNGETLIKRTLDNITPEQFSRIILVVGYHKKMIRDFLGDSHNGVPIVYVDNPVYDKTNNVYSLYLARHLLAEEDTVLMESDLIYEKSIFTALLNSKYPNVVVVDKYQSHMDGTVIKIGGNNEVTAFIAKNHFDYKEIDSYYKTVNMYRFSKEFSRNTYIPFLESYCKVLGFNKYYEQVLRVILTLDQRNLKALILNGQKWYEIDSIPDLHNAELLFASMPDEKLKLYESRYGGYWRNEAVLDYCYLVNPFFPSPHLIEEMKNNFAPLLTNYPSGQATQSLLAAEWFSCHERYMAVGNGAAELISVLLPALPGKAGIMLPTFNEYVSRMPAESLIKLRPRGKRIHYDENDLLERLDEMDTLMLVNPDNPSGNFISWNGMMRLLEECRRRNKKLIVDDSFMDFADKDKRYNLLSNAVLEANPHLTVIKSLSKSLGAPGLRLGVAASADCEWIAAIRRRMHIWNINSFAEFFLQLMPKYRGEFRKSCEKLAAERADMIAELGKMPGLVLFPSQANYVLCRLPGGMDAAAFAGEVLFSHDIMLKNCSSKEGLEGGQFLRISIRSAVENKVMLKGFSATLEKMMGGGRA